ncbi:hypothetical protein Leryth_027225 [Lithospermum erythrorhizon]|nr:hypothetical protein Leryth_027225 [Lithospermum erythrorhizon]
MNNDEKKATLGRRKIDIKKIEDKGSRQVTFTKRRKGLFTKASELCQLCGAEIAIIVTSQKGKLFTFGHPNVTPIINRYQKNEEHNDDYQPKVEQVNLSGVMGKLKSLEAERNHLKELNKKGAVKDENSNGKGKNIFWWQKDTSAMNLAELKEFRDSIEALRNNIRKKTNEMTITRNSQKSRSEGYKVRTYMVHGWLLLAGR